MKKGWSGGGLEVTVVVRVAEHGVGGSITGGGRRWVVGGRGVDGGSDGMILVRDGGGACGDEMEVGGGVGCSCDEGGVRVVDLIDRDTGSLFGVRQKRSPKKFFGDGGGDRRRAPGGRR
nr:hypothetical protein [Tanacetum cinerariifolium]